MLYAHGTTLSRANAIIADLKSNNKLTTKDDSVWGCSAEEHFYLWSAQAILERDNDEWGEYEEEEAKEEMIGRAFENASIQTIIDGESRIAVLIFDIPEAVELPADNSCDNMAGAVTIELEAMRLEYLKEVLFVELNKYLIPFIVAPFLNSRNPNFSDFYVDNRVYDAAEIIAESVSDCYVAERVSEECQGYVNYSLKDIFELGLLIELEEGAKKNA